jgi:hypothetical protein
METRKAFENLSLDQSTDSSQNQVNYYGRTSFNGVLMHNDRINSVYRLMNKQNQNVNKFEEKKIPPRPA